MAQTRSSEQAAPVGSLDIGGDWPKQAADTVVRLVDQVTAKTTSPVLTIARVVVYGAMASFLGLFALVILLVVAVRLPDAYIPGDVYWVELGWGLLLTVVGLLVFRKRVRR